MFKVFAKSILLYFRVISFKKSSKNPSKMRPEHLKKNAKNMLFFDIDFFMFLHRFWKVLGLQVGAKLAVLGCQDAPKSLENPIFWEHVSRMLVKRLQKGSQGASDIDFWRIFDGFGSLFSSFSAVKVNSLDRNSRYHMYLLSDAIT